MCQDNFAYQSAAQPGDRRVVHRQRLLRPERPPAGEIRNAASRSQRRLHGEASSAALWFFASVLLSGSGDVHARWPGRAGTAEAGTAPCSQAVAKDHGIYRAEHRAGVGTSEKKTTLAMTGHDGPVDRTDGSEQVTRYEDLRRHVIGHGGGHRLSRMPRRTGMIADRAHRAKGP